MSFGSIILVLSMVVFAGIVWWAFSPRFKKTHEKDGMIPFLDSRNHPPESFDQGDESKTSDKSKS
ncbi:MAG: cbb3-type cytochrome c oxidase subunit 3 [Thiomonas sp.]|uniref:cbb3-type cytochrome oxidase subunit 3 n=1 Tax=Thiomonas sp. TaxID=2047785 RepID=UPI002A36ED36|nr:cbb3-type cytochrome c oxidase subunit 3 [Thiomonas sp.]MDY0328948.1 cbb3-type cytochrome c oxidase subunit 3 [Thiomonas sp.]